MSNKIILFTLDGCHHCVELKKLIIKASIPFTEIEVGENQAIWDQVVSQTGDNALPTVYISINGEEDGPVYVAGRDFTDKEEFVKILKTYV